MDAYEIEQSIYLLERYSCQSEQIKCSQPFDLRKFTLRDARIDYGVYAKAIQKIAGVHGRSRLNDYGGGLLITGLTGTGKTSALRHYASQFPATDGDLGRQVTVLYVQTPSAPTVKNFAEAILSALGDPASCKGTSEEKTRRIYRFFEACQVELLLVDEFQHFAEVSRRGATREVTDWLKNLINVSKAGVVLSGLPACESTISYNPQLARRFSAHHQMLTFSYLSNVRQLEFRGVLQSLQSMLPIPSLPLHSDAFARRMFVASYGLIDYVVKIVEEACDIARRIGETELTLPIFSDAFKDSVWGSCPDELDPFRENFSCKRALDQPGEPFAKMTRHQVSDGIPRG